MTHEHSGSTTEERIRRHLDPQRSQKLDPLAVFSFIGINAYEVVADVGCGPGYFTLPLAKSLSSGKVYALDIDDDMLAACRQRVEQARLSNVEVLKCEDYWFPLEKGKVDGVLLSLVLHHSDDHVRFLREVRELLRSGGWCGVVEWMPQQTEGGPPPERRITQEQLASIAQKAGLRPVSPGWRRLNDEQYLTVLRAR